MGYAVYGYWETGYSTLDGSQKTSAELQKLEHSAIIDLYILDATVLGNPTIRYFFPGTNPLGGSLIWQGVAYDPMPIMSEGFAKTTEGKMPRPKLRIANITGLMGAIAREYGDLVGATITRKRTLAKFLDEVNFAGGNPNADPTQEISTETWKINQKTSEDALLVEFELAATADVQGFKIPSRIIQAHYCPWKYRSPGVSALEAPECTNESNNPICTHLLQGENGCMSHFMYTEMVTVYTIVGYTDPVYDQEGNIVQDSEPIYESHLEPRETHHPLPFGGFPGVSRL